MEQGDVGAAGQLIQRLSSALLVRAGMSQQPPADLEPCLHQQTPSVTSLARTLLRASGLPVPIRSHSGNALCKLMALRGATEAGTHCCWLHLVDQGKSANEWS